VVQLRRQRTHCVHTAELPCVAHGWWWTVARLHWQRVHCGAHGQSCRVWHTGGGGQWCGCGGSALTVCTRQSCRVWHTDSGGQWRGCTGSACIVGHTGRAAVCSVWVMVISGAVAAAACALCGTPAALLCVELQAVAQLWLHASIGCTHRRSGEGCLRVAGPGTSYDAGAGAASDFRFLQVRSLSSYNFPLLHLFGFAAAHAFLPRALFTPLVGRICHGSAARC
jgi:hypothetical protein